MQIGADQIIFVVRSSPAEDQHAHYDHEFGTVPSTKDSLFQSSEGSAFQK